MIIWPDGDVTEVERTFKLEFKDELTTSEVVDYYYTSTGIKSMIGIPKDGGGVKYLVKQLGLDVTLFAIDALIDDYMEADNRPANPPDLIKASDYAQQGLDRLGRVKQTAIEYGIDERTYYAGQTV
jgi:hypothetical protein